MHDSAQVLSCSTNFLPSSESDVGRGGASFGTVVSSLMMLFLSVVDDSVPDGLESLPSVFGLESTIIFDKGMSSLFFFSLSTSDLGAVLLLLVVEALLANADSGRSSSNDLFLSATLEPVEVAVAFFFFLLRILE